MSSNSGNATGGNTPWGWLGLLKWSLAYSDGTSPTSASPMSDEDKAFLEKVMKEGIIDENERMKEILQEVTVGLEEIQQDAAGGKEDLQDEMENLLQELRDIVEQIDYARAFAAMKGLAFLLGCVSQKEVPNSIQTSCLGILATMASNNPPIQKELLEMGAIKMLTEVFQTADATKYSFRAKIIQALSATVRSYELSEQVFCGVNQAKEIVFEGLQKSTEGNYQVLQKRTLFFLRALITSDDSTRERVRLFAHSIAYTADNLVVPASDKKENDTPGKAEIREMGLALLLQILEQKKSVNTILDRKDNLVAAGVKRVQTLRALTGEDREFAALELETWEALLVQLSRAVPDVAETPLMITAANPDVEPQ